MTPMPGAGQPDRPAVPHRWRLDLGYDGTRFSGWATQPGLRTVQGELEGWLTRILRCADPIDLVVAGRTDAGVHARGQVAHFDVDQAAVEPFDGTELCRRLRRVLPEDIVVRSACRAPHGFDARFAAIWRRYAYRLWDTSSTRDPLRRLDVATVSQELDPAAMNMAGAALVGLRDFAPFCKRRDGATTIRTLFEASSVRLDDGLGTILTTVRADAFCHSMVRSLMGAITAVGAGRRDLTWLADVIASPTRHSSVLVMPPGGLTLEAVGYPAEADLAARAEQARAFRTLPEGV